jgi:hypothetical protein
MYKKLALVLLALFGFAASASAQEILVDSIVGDKTLTNDRTWLIRGYVYVVSGAKLTIEPGTIIFGEKTTKGTLIVERGAQIIARGEPNNPIVFTSQMPPGQRAHGDWGGIIICGRAPINLSPGERQVEGGPRSFYGGNQTNDYSGVLKYVRIEFPGIALSPNNEVNGLTLAGVGSLTEMDHIQVSYSGDDAFEWFGGNVNAKYLIAHRAVDDDWDTDFGWSGKLQFGVSLRDPQVADISTSNGIESDNNNVPNTAEPRTRATFSNMTIIGPMRDTTDQVNPLFGTGAHLRRNTLQSVYNSVIMGWPRGGLLLDAAGVREAAENGSLEVLNTVIAGAKLPYVRTTVTGFDALNWFNTSTRKNGYVQSVNQLEMIDPYNLTKPSFLTTPTSPLNNKAAFTASRVNDPFFTKVEYIGAFNSNSDWTLGWANFDPQQTVYAPQPAAGIASVVFPNTAVGSTKDSTVIVIRNTGGAAFAVTNFMITDSTNFKTPGTGSTFIVPTLSSKQVTIRFAPTDTNTRTTQITFTAEGQPYTINLQGKGTQEQPKLAVETGTKLDFALVRTGESVQDRIIIANTGTVPVSISNIAISGADASAFSIVSGGEGATLAPKAKHTIWVSFSPNDTRDYSASISFDHNASGGSSTVQLMGKGIVVYGQDVIKDSVVGNVTLTNDRIWLLRGFVYVVDGATLNIEPGTVIFGEKSTKGTLIVERGGKINAQGTPELPIVFTSQMPPGQRAPGDWGGIIIAGRAPINMAGGELQVEGGPRTRYGGTIENDNSGVFSYVRIEYPGIALSPNNEINGLTLAAVGSATKIDHVQVSFSGDDAFEWFGGTSNATHLIANRSVDDDFDTDFGYNGRVQFGVSQRDPQLADISGSNSFESDNNNVPNTATPRTAPQFSNMTIVGPLAEPTTTINPLFRNAAHIRRNSLMSLYNSVIVGWPGGILLDQTGVVEAAQSGELMIHNVTLAGVNTGKEITTNVQNFDPVAWFNTNSFSNTIVALNAGAGLVSPFDLTNPNFTPSTGSILLGSSSFEGTTGFENVAYRGAFGASPWDSLWANWNSGATVYAAAPEYSTESIDFGTVSIGSSSTRTLTVTNAGEAPLVVTGVTFSNPRFSLSEQTNFVVVQGASRQLELQFMPTTDGAQAGTVTLNFSDNNVKTVNLTGNGTSSVKSTTVSKGITLKQNSPNPVAASTQIAFNMERPGFVTLQVVDVTGRAVATLHNDNLTSGDHAFSFDAQNLPAGTYIYHLNVDGVSVARTMVVAR